MIQRISDIVGTANTSDISIAVNNFYANTFTPGKGTIGTSYDLETVKKMVEMDKNGSLRRNYMVATGLVDPGTNKAREPFTDFNYTEIAAYVGGGLLIGYLGAKLLSKGKK